MHGDEDIEWCENNCCEQCYCNEIALTAMRLEEDFIAEEFWLKELEDDDNRRD